MRKKELPIWFKVETITFIFFSGAMVVSYFEMTKDSDSQFLLIKLILLLSGLWLAWLISLVMCCYKK